MTGNFTLPMCIMRTPDNNHEKHLKRSTKASIHPHCILKSKYRNRSRMPNMAATDRPMITLKMGVLRGSRQKTSCCSVMIWQTYIQFSKQWRSYMVRDQLNLHYNPLDTESRLLLSSALRHQQLGSYEVPLLLARSKNTTSWASITEALQFMPCWSTDNIRLLSFRESDRQLYHCLHAVRARLAFH
jgi:hypothetical protein